MQNDKNRIEGLNFLVDLLHDHGTANLSFTTEHIDFTSIKGNVYKVFSDDGLVFRVENNQGVKTFNKIMEVVNYCQ